MRNLLFTLLLLLPTVAKAQDLRSGFTTPPQEARPRVWWHWMNGNITKEGINAAMKAASNESFGYTEDEIVSSDVIGMKFGSLFDATQTMVSKIDDDTYQVQVVSWYDNENSYTSQMIRTIKYLAELK